MRTYRKRRRKNRSRKPGRSRLPLILLSVLVVLGGAGCIAFLFIRSFAGPSPDELLVSYMEHIPKGEYEEMYGMLAVERSGNISRDDFVARNSAIYEGIGLESLQTKSVEYNKENKSVTYETMLETSTGTIQFENEAAFAKGEHGWELVWQDALIFPELGSEDKVRVSTDQAERGEILDRNGKVLAGKGTASSVGVVPGKLEDEKEAVQTLARLLDMEPEAISEKLSAAWVKEDSFVPLATLPKVEELELSALDPDEKTVEEAARQEKLLEIPGVMLSDTEIREYPLGEAAAHLVGYVQSVTAEDLEEHAGEGYSSNSVIGKSGMEGLFEKELKGADGRAVEIVNREGTVKAVLASVPKENGRDIQLTIDGELQKSLYQQFQEDEGCSVAMEPYTGEVLALVSTPSYDNNAFIRGLSGDQWTAWNEDEAQPLYNRFRQVWCPGSVFKPVTAGIALENGTLDPQEDYGSEGLSWQKDASWGSYKVTTLHAYEPVNLKNALIYSDNIYFAKVALKLGADALEGALDGLGFNQELPFEIKMSESQYSNGEGIDEEIQLADSGYGQGEILINPLHLTSLYTAFLNGGDVRKPYLQYQKGEQGEIWLEGVFTEEHVQEVMEGLQGVINDPNGTGYSAHREDVLLAGKTGTAEIKESQEDTTGTELGWFAVFTAGQEAKKPILLVSMVEDVKDRGGSGYVVRKTAAALDEYLED